MTLYKNKYRSESARAQWWDYGWAAAYFVTICTKDRRHYFGEINDGKMNLTGFTFEWQSRFHDHIIRDDLSYQRIARYIKTNPENWKDDKFNSELQITNGTALCLQF